MTRRGLLLLGGGEDSPRFVQKKAFESEDGASSLEENEGGKISAKEEAALQAKTEKASPPKLVSPVS